MPSKEPLRARWNSFWLYRSCTASFELKDLKTRGDLALNEADHFRYADLSVSIAWRADISESTVGAQHRTSVEVQTQQRG